MARQTGLIKIKGTLDNVNFYKTKDGDLARMKTSVDGTRIANDPAFERTRENNQEFGNAAQAGKLMRDALRPIALNATDGRMVSRLTQLMAQIKNMDVDSPRGQRTVSNGIVDPNAVLKLKGVDFNKQALMSSILFKPYSVDTTTGEITINGLNPVTDVVIPQGATHLELSGAFATIDFLTGENEMISTGVVSLAIDSTLTDVALTPDGVPTGPGVKFYLLKVAFYQLVNGVMYSLKNGAYNSLKVIEAI
jgi:hypothetical protein